MDVCHAEVSPHKIEEQKQYFNKKIPSKVHQIWFGNADNRPKKIDLWVDFCNRFGYEYKLWTENSLEEASSFVSSKNMEYIKLFLAQENYWAASDILRYEILRELGGIYVDCDFSPPVYEEEMIDLREITSMQGLTVVTEHKGRDVGESALFAMNGFLMASPGHPVILSMTEQLDKNIKSWNKRTGNYDAMFVTGPFMFNKVLFGNFNLVPLTYLQYFNMY